MSTSLYDGIPSKRCFVMSSETDTVVEVQGVSKKFAQTEVAARRQLAELFLDVLFARDSRDVSITPGEFWAVKDVSFSIKRGEAVGLIGLNGAGKSTLLKIIAGYLLPDKGEVRVCGSVASLIELSAGFQPDLSGRENILLKGVLFGRSREYILSALDEIVEFAELGDFIDAPVRTYSSGMAARLGFAVAIHCNPDIMVVDEALSVGDFRFKQKCLRRVQELRERSSFVLVSHSMNDISRFCERTIVLCEGQVAFQGPTDDAIRCYLSEQQADTAKRTQGPKKTQRAKKGVEGAPKSGKSFLEPFFCNEDLIQNVEHFWVNSNDQLIDVAHTGEAISMVVRFQLKWEPRNLVVAIPIFAADGVRITAIASDVPGFFIKPEPSGRVVVKLELPSVNLNSGEYYAVVSIHDGPEWLYRQPAPCLRISTGAVQEWGYFTPKYYWRQLPLNMDAENT